MSNFNAPIAKNKRDDERSKKRIEEIFKSGGKILKIFAAIETFNGAVTAIDSLLKNQMLQPLITEFSYTIHAVEKDMMYDYIIKYIKNLKLPKIDRNTIELSKIDSRIKKSEIKHGTYNYMYDKMTLCQIKAYKADLDSKDSKKESSSNAISVTFIGRSAYKGYMEMITSLSEISDKLSREKITVTDSDWNKFKIKPKDLSSIFQHGIKDFTKSLDNAVQRKDVFDEMGEIHKFGVLLYGDPGCGKTTYISALAKRYNADIFMLSLSDSWWKYNLYEAIKNTPENKFLFIVIEDIDFYTMNRDDMTEDELKDKEKISNNIMSDIFNVLDGFQAREKIITFMTSNKIENLDPGLIRYGRVDYKFKFHNLDRELQINMAKHYGLSEEDIKIDTIPEEVTPATFRKYIMDIKMGIIKPFKEYEEYKREIERRLAEKEKVSKKKTTRKKTSTKKTDVVKVDINN